MLQTQQIAPSPGAQPTMHPATMHPRCTAIPGAQHSCSPCASVLRCARRDHHDSRPAAEESQAPPHSPVSDADKPPAILSSSCTFHHGPIPPPGLIDPDGPKGTYALRMHSVPSNVWGASGKLSAVSEGIGTQQVCGCLSCIASNALTETHTTL